MRKIISLAVSALASIAVTIGAAKADGTLTIYTYESFTAEWGPGPQVEKAFEETCSCDLKFVSVADGVALLNRVKLEGADTEADIVMGLDTNLISDAKASGLVAPHSVSLENLTIPDGWYDDTFVPYDYGYFAVIYDSEKIKQPPRSLDELINGDPNVKIAIQDPRTSTPGLGLLLWIKHVYGDDAAKKWEIFAKRVLTVTPGWSEAYGLFTSGEVPMVLSYTTSPAYHMIAESTERYQAASFREGHYLQIELAAKTNKGSDNPLADQFLEFMISPAFQDIIPETNWMFPAAPTSKALNPAFEKLVQPQNTLLFDSEEAALNRKAWVDEWLQVMSK